MSSLSTDCTSYGPYTKGTRGRTDPTAHSRPFPYFKDDCHRVRDSESFRGCRGINKGSGFSSHPPVPLTLEFNYFQNNNVDK